MLLPTSRYSEGVTSNYSVSSLSPWAVPFAARLIPGILFLRDEVCVEFKRLRSPLTHLHNLAVQGFGGGGLIALASIILADLVPLRERGVFNGLIGM